MAAETCTRSRELLAGHRGDAPVGEGVQGLQVGGSRATVASGTPLAAAVRATTSSGWTRTIVSVGVREPVRGSRRRCSGTGALLASGPSSYVLVTACTKSCDGVAPDRASATCGPRTVAGGSGAHARLRVSPRSPEQTTRRPGAAVPAAARRPRAAPRPAPRPPRPPGSGPSSGRAARGRRRPTPRPARRPRGGTRLDHHAGPRRTGGSPARRRAGPAAAGGSCRPAGAHPRNTRAPLHQQRVQGLLDHLAHPVGDLEDDHRVVGRARVQLVGRRRARRTR